MEITGSFKNGAEFAWKNVKAAILNSVFTDVVALSEKDEAARKAVKRQGRLNGTKKVI